MRWSPYYQDTIVQLRECYDTHAHKFSSTRKKNRSEFDYLAKQIIAHPHSHKGLHIVELWCGDGRFYNYLYQQHPHLIKSYQGVDISQNLLTVAQHRQKEDTKAKRIHDDMIHFLTTQESESCDIILCIASFQHLPDIISRSQVLSQCYRILNYEWVWLSIDRSWSRWLIHKYRSTITKSFKQYILTLGQNKWNNLLIPFSDQWKNKKRRLYHIFTIRELKLLLKKHGFSWTYCIYSSQKWNFHHNILQARNICTSTIKQVFLKKSS